MIKNELQYQITKAQVQKFENAIRMHEAQLAALRSQLQDLQAELDQFETVPAPSKKIPEDCP